MMRIAFVDKSQLSYDAETPFNRPLGGTQSAACYLAMALSRRGVETALFMHGFLHDPQWVGGVLCRRYDAVTAKDLNAFDVVVVLTSPIAVELRSLGVSVPLINWQHKAVDSRGVAPFNDPSERAAWSGTVFVSETQKNDFEKRWGLQGKVIKNAISPAMERVSRSQPGFWRRGEDPTLVYASAPGRGLDNILISFASIKENLPGAKLKVFSDQAMYQVDYNVDDFSSYYALARSIPGVEYIGGISQTRLADELVNSDIWAYPTTFVETSCIVLMEAAAAGCLLLFSDIGALRETGERFGRRMTPKSTRSAWCSAYARGICSETARLRADPDAADRFFSDQAAWYREHYTWDRRAMEWKRWLGEAGLVKGG